MREGEQKTERLNRDAIHTKRAAIVILSASIPMSTISLNAKILTLYLSLHSRLVKITGKTAPECCESETARKMKMAPGRPPSMSLAAARKAFPTEQLRNEKCLWARLRMRVLKWTRNAKHIDRAVSA